MVCLGIGWESLAMRYPLLAKFIPVAFRDRETIEKQQGLLFFLRKRGADSPFPMVFLGYV